MNVCVPDSVTTCPFYSRSAPTHAMTTPVYTTRQVLSVETALSIQSHPDKRLAERLHAQRPEVYKDPNHKPEMALSLTDFEALCGFVTHEELCAELQAHPELRACVGEEHTAALLLAGGADARKAALQAAFTALMTCPSDQGGVLSCTCHTPCFSPF